MANTSKSLYEGIFLQILLTQDVKRKAELLQSSPFKNIPVYEFYFVALIKVHTPVGKEDTETRKAYSIIQKSCAKQRLHLQKIFLQDTIILLCGENSLPEMNLAKDKLQMLLLHVIKKHSPVLICASGSIYKGLLNAAKSHQEARITLDIVAHMKGTSMLEYREGNLLTVLATLSSNPLCTEYLMKKIQPVAEYRRSFGPIFLNTLKVFLDTNCNFYHTADILSVHYNTVYYRIKKIREMTKVDFENHYQALEMLLALLMYDYQTNNLTFIPKEN
jgi:sugar diacid utilization regulator